MHACTHTHTPARQLDNQRPMWVRAGTPQRHKRKQGEQCTWFWFSWRLYNGETSARRWGAQGIQSERAPAGESAPMSLGQRGTVSEKGSLSVLFDNQRCFNKTLVKPNQTWRMYSRGLKLRRCHIKRWTAFVRRSMHSALTYITKRCIVYRICIYVDILFQGKV